MNISKVDIQIPRMRAVIFQDTDTHIDADGHDHFLHKRFCSKIESDPDAYWLHTGDCLDDDRKSTRERKSAAFHDRAEVVYKWEVGKLREINDLVIPRYRPIASKCLGLIDGDHFYQFNCDHDKFGVKAGMTSGQYLCKSLGMPYLGERMGYISVVFRTNGRQSIRYDILARHGRGAAKTQSGDVASLTRANSGWDGDAMFGGHSHRQNVHCEQIIGINQARDGFYCRTRMYVRGGSFLKGFIVGKRTYALQAEYGPLCLGWGMLELNFAKPYRNNSNLEIVESKGSISVG